MLDVLNVVGFAATAAALVIATWQLIRTRRATEAVQTTLVETQRQLAENHLLLVIPQLELLHHQFAARVEQENIDEARACLRDWRRRAMEVRTYVTTQESGRESVAAELSAAIALVTTADENLRDGCDAVAATQKLRAQMDLAGERLADIVDQRKISLFRNKGTPDEQEASHTRTLTT